ncbi:hypothetical protein BD410DRAFT_635643 [Rickenella mellea]|uniref:Uncharacterized protein n=1 Tax=Rickenella mellea TaxID=50990 RepID=A0A4Y7QEM1_9AGAM|nr:hypothetical protein BD410DRAFT_635643 [Rickenella mellea]
MVDQMKYVGESFEVSCSTASTSKMIVPSQRNGLLCNASKKVWRSWNNLRTTTSLTMISRMGLPGHGAAARRPIMARRVNEICAESRSLCSLSIDMALSSIMFSKGVSLRTHEFHRYRCGNNATNCTIRRQRRDRRAERMLVAVAAVHKGR